MSSVKIIRTSGNELHRHYDRQTNAQGCYIELDCANDTLSASYNAEIGNAIPFSVYHGHDQRFGIPCLTGDAANSLIDDILPLAERVVAGYKSEWDGNNHVASFTDDAQAAIEEIEEKCNAIDADESNAVVEWDVGDWLDNGNQPDADTSDADLAQMVSDSEPYEDNIVINGDIEEYYNRTRYEARRDEIETVLDDLDTVDEYRNESRDDDDPDYIVRFQNGRIAYLSYNADGKQQWRRSDLISDSLTSVDLGIAECNLYRKNKPVGGDAPRRREIEPATAYDAARCETVKPEYRKVCREQAIKKYRSELVEGFRQFAEPTIVEIKKYDVVQEQIAKLQREIEHLKNSLPSERPTVEYFSMSGNAASARLDNLGAGITQKELETIVLK
jgi:hypothetical protein